MRPRERLVLPTEIDNPPHRRERREVAFKIERADCIPGETDIRDGDLVAMAIAAGLLRAGEIGFERLECRLMPVMAPFLHAGFVDLVFVREKLADARYDKRVSIARNDLRERAHACTRLRRFRQ